MFAYECVNLLSYFHKSCVVLSYVPLQWAAGALCRRVMEQARYGYLTVPFTPPPQKYFSLQPIVQVHKIKTHNFYEIKVDF